MESPESRLDELTLLWQRLRRQGQLVPVEGRCRQEQRTLPDKRSAVQRGSLHLVGVVHVIFSNLPAIVAAGLAAGRRVRTLIRERVAENLEVLRSLVRAHPACSLLRVDAGTDGPPKR